MAPPEHRTHVIPAYSDKLITSGAYMSKPAEKQITPVVVSTVYETIAHAEFLRVGGEFDTFDPIIRSGDASDEAAESATPRWKFLLAGAVAGAISRTSTAPLDRLRIVLIVGKRDAHPPPKAPSGASGAAAAAQAKPHGLIGTAYSILHQEGVRSFWKGNFTNCLKIAPESAVKFFVFESAKKLLIQRRAGIMERERAAAAEKEHRSAQGEDETASAVEEARARKALPPTLAGGVPCRRAEGVKEGDGHAGDASSATSTSATTSSAPTTASVSSSTPSKALQDSSSPSASEPAAPSSTGAGDLPPSCPATTSPSGYTIVHRFTSSSKCDAPPPVLGVPQTIPRGFHPPVVYSHTAVQWGGTAMGSLPAAAAAKIAASDDSTLLQQAGAVLTAVLCAADGEVAFAPHSTLLHAMRSASSKLSERVPHFSVEVVEEEGGEGASGGEVVKPSWRERVMERVTGEKKFGVAAGAPEMPANPEPCSLTTRFRRLPSTVYGYVTGRRPSGVPEDAAERALQPGRGTARNPADEATKSALPTAPKTRKEKAALAITAPSSSAGGRGGDAKGTSSQPAKPSLSLSDRIIAGSAAGLVVQSTVHPLEVMKVHLAAAPKGFYHGIGQCAQHILKTRGPIGFYQGFRPAILGMIPFCAMDLAMFDTFRVTANAFYSSLDNTRWVVVEKGWGQGWSKASTKPAADKAPTTVPVGKDGEPLVPVSFMLRPLCGVRAKDGSVRAPGVAILACGCLATLIASFFTYPLNFVKTNLMVQGMNKQFPVVYGGTMHALQDTLKKKGVRGWYRGILPNMLKAVPASGIGYLSYNVVLRTLGAQSV